jgi:hypothetical protein
MADPTYGRFQAPGSLAQLTRGRGFNSELVGFLLPFAVQDYLYIEDDFTSDTLASALWSTVETNGGTAFAAGALENGTIRGITDAGAGDTLSIKYDRTIFDAARNPGCEIRWKTNAVPSTAGGMEFYFADPPTAEDATIIDDIDTPSVTNGVTDVVGIGRQKGATLTTATLFSVGTTDTTCAKDDFPTTLIPTVDVYTRMLIQVATRRGWGVIDNQWDYDAISRLGTGPDTGVLMRPSFLVVGDTAATTVDIDYIRIWAERA